MKQTRTGFTLIEVVVALTLFSISVLVLTQSFMNGLMCKTTLEKEDTRPFVLFTIRQQLYEMERDKVTATHIIPFPDNETKVEWQGSVEFSKILNLYKVSVKIKDQDEPLCIWLHRPDWMTNDERSTVQQKWLTETNDA